MLSVVLGGLLVGYVSAGIARARRLRIVVASVVVVLSVLGALADLISGEGLGQAAHGVLALTAAALSLVGLLKFCRSDWYAWQRMRPPTREGASIGQLVAMGVLVGALGGYVGLVDAGLTMRVNVNVG